MIYQDALLEIGCEELPVDYIAPAMKQLKEMADKIPETIHLGCTGVEVQATPRRISVFLREVASEQPRTSKKVMGPTLAVAYGPNKTLTPAGEGFLRKCGLRPDQAREENGRLVAEIVDSVKTAQTLLPETFLQWLRSVSFPKSMRWEASGVRFARPIRWIIALYGKEILPMEFAGIKSGRTTHLHPLAPSTRADIDNPGQYAAVLKKGFVILDVAQRRAQLQTALEQEAERLGGRVVADAELLDMVTMMAEYPAVLSGQFDPGFLKLPREIIVTAMREHQRYFAVETADNRLLPAFLTAYDNPLARPDTIRPGCERVLEARLKDAEFFYQEDLKHPLVKRVPELDRVLWIKGLGSLKDKTDRLERLAEGLAGLLEPEARAAAARAAHLSKADLITRMIQEKEYNSLQGLMGGYYVQAQNEGPVVARAISEQYLPRWAGDEKPESPAGRILALADKFDHLAGCWGAGLIPTGTKDPYALRRAAQGIVAVTLEAGYRYSLADAIGAAVNNFPSFSGRSTAVAAGIKDFIIGRTETELENLGCQPDLIQALLAVWIDDLTALVQKAKTLLALREAPEFVPSITAFSRVVNILPKGTPRNLPPQTADEAVEDGLLTPGAEQELSQAHRRLRPEIARLAATGDFAGVFQALQQLAPTIDRFFTEVLVMDPVKKVRSNRLHLLENIARSIWQLADFSRLVISAS